MLNQLINVAVAEKLAALRTLDYLRERTARADLADALARPSHQGPSWRRRPLVVRAFWAWWRSGQRSWAC